MTGKEADKIWQAKKAALLADWATLPRADKMALITKAREYRSGNDSCNSVYMGSTATHMLYRELAPGKDFADILEMSTDKQLDKALAVCAGVLDYAEHNPRERCPCCGAITTDDLEIPAPASKLDLHVEEIRALVSDCAGYEDAPLISAADTLKVIQAYDMANSHRWQAVQNLKTYRQMVREAIGELFGPVASLESEDATLLRGPETVHDAEGVIDALRRVRDELRKVNLL